MGEFKNVRVDVVREFSYGLAPVAMSKTVSTQTGNGNVASEFE